MGINYSPTIISEGIIMCVDGSNNRSYSGTGSTWLDLSGFGINGTLVSSPSFSSNIFTFNGSNYVNFGNTSTVQQNSGTLSAWVRASSPGAGFRGIIAKQGAYGLFYFDSVLVTYDWGGAVTRSTGLNIADGNWKNTVLTYQSGVTNGTNVYLNGRLVLTTTITIQSQPTGNLFGAAEANANQIAACSAAFFSMYNRALSATEVLQNFNATRSRFGL